MAPTELYALNCSQLVRANFIWAPARHSSSVATVQIHFKGSSAFRSSSSRSYDEKRFSRSSFCVQRRTLKKVGSACLQTVGLNPPHDTKSPSVAFTLCIAPRNSFNVLDSTGVSPD